MGRLSPLVGVGGMMIIFGGANMYIGMRLLGDQGNETRVRSCQHTRLLRTRHSVWTPLCRHRFAECST